MNDKGYRQETSVGLQAVGAAAWVKDMQAHFAQTGSYRSQDVQRVLGNPRDVVSMAGLASLSANRTRTHGDR